MKSPANIVQDHITGTLTERARKLVNRSAAAVGAVAVAGGIAGFVDMAHQGAESLTQPTSAELKANEDLLQSHHGLTGTITLKSGVKLRLSPQLIDGDNQTGTPSNIALTVPQGHTLRVPAAIEAQDGWVAFERPADSEGNPADMAQNLVYVDAAELEANSPGSIAGAGEAFTNSYVDSNGHVQPFNPALESMKPEVIQSGYINIQE